MLSDDELLRTVREERRRSIGFGEADSGELTAAREKGLQYYKGEMLDVVAAANRSSVVDTAVADAIETVLPDVMEIFIGGDDVATFVPQGEDDEEAAEEESDYITHVIMQDNDGFLLLYTAFKDALLTRTGVFHWWWEDEEKTETRHTLAPEQAPLAPQAQALNDFMGGEPLESEEQEDGSVNLNATVKTGHVRVVSVAPEDFSVAFDTTSDLQATTYCVMRARPRIQDLIANGLDAETVRELPNYVQRNDTLVEERDEAGENAQRQDGTSGDLRVVEVRYHYVRVLDGLKTVIVKVTTDGQETMLLDKPEVVERIPFAAVTPYLVPHRFYGESVADKLIEVQKIKTVLMRSHLDGIYFALNQRNYVDMTKANEFTIPDLLRNAPGVPVRGKGEGAVTPLQAGPLNVDTLAALEYVDTVAEKRSGIVRNAQGLNPDSLHDTAAGAMQLIAAAQKRVRMIARILAETGIKDLWLGVHAMLRSGYTDEHAPAKAKLKKQWKAIQPNSWQERSAMTIHVGVGSAGRDHDLMVAGKRLELMEKVVEMQGGLHGPLVTPPDAYNALQDMERASGSKRGDTFWTDPSAPPDPNNPPPEPPPNPEMMKVQAQIQGAQAKQQSEAQIAQQRQQSEQAMAQIKAQSDEAAAARDFQLQQQRIEGELALKRDEMVQKAQLERWQAEQAIELQRQEAAATVMLKREEIRAKARVGTDVDSATDELPGGDG